MADRITIADVAAAAGVSKSAASRALLAQPGVSDDARQHVEAVAARLGYIKDVRAQALKAKNTKIIGVFVRSVRLSFYGEMIAHLQEHLEEAGFSLAVGTASAGTTPGDVLAGLLGLRPEALVIASGRMPEAQIVPVAQRLPTVLMGRASTSPSIGSVCDDGRGAEVLAGLIAHAGHRAVGVLHVAAEHSTTLHQRSTRMQRALTEAGIDTVAIPRAAAGDHPEPDILARCLDDVSVIMCPNDPTLLSTWEQLTALGVRVPDDIALTGYDGIGQLASPVLGLTTWRQPIEQITAATARQVLRRLTGDSPPERIELPGDLIRGRTLPTYLPLG
ncbi:LacI family DNA-binding transcriptional regulator [Rhodococcus sp. TAF43]|uniref:LacI family DNA-binding transcriptional regulator n=1 Tax=unclassified Rhodococcus (in: high G+C Gram-positive bacteria) TaxID=192944 RepID=UPI000E0BAD48|nr:MULTISPECIES: LacI family DNA-binding transcriptional regulator [unclassified Rhodococcus (in: high G+C Gram-positive bacteria)]QKT10695.1 LacI family DNA-binding transcriptional regulator [Rhodococcus sp. W8901]RDI35852.1 LacI family transcriptional regulator [Rhodococcus sp. AG1013]